MILITNYYCHRRSTISSNSSRSENTSRVPSSVIPLTLLITNIRLLTTNPRLTMQSSKRGIHGNICRRGEVETRFSCCPFHSSSSSCYTAIASVTSTGHPRPAINPRMPLGRIQPQEVVKWHFRWRTQTGWRATSPVAMNCGRCGDFRSDRVEPQRLPMKFRRIAVTRSPSTCGSRASHGWAMRTWWRDVLLLGTCMIDLGTRCEILRETAGDSDFHNSQGGRPSTGGCCTRNRKTLNSAFPSHSSHSVVCSTVSQDHRPSIIHPQQRREWLAEIHHRWILLLSVDDFWS